MRTLNLGILAHVDAGKTSLTERLLHAAGVIDEIGSVDAGSTQTDTLALERQRGITIKSAVVSYVIDDVTVNLIDTPGHPDFIAEVERVLSVLDGAVLVISAVEGVQAQTRVLMRTLQRLRIPTLIFVNKIDRDGADAERTLADIADKLTPAIIAMGTADGLGDRNATVTSYAATDAGFVASLVDLLADHDDTFLAAYVHDEAAASYRRLRAHLAARTAQAAVHPVFVGSAITGAGVAALTAGLTELLPTAHTGGTRIDSRHTNSTHTHTHEAQASDVAMDGPVSGTVFKVERGPAGDKIAYARMFTGTVHTRDRLRFGHHPDGTKGGRASSNVQAYENKVTAIHVFAHGTAAAAASLTAGQIGKLWGLRDIQIGDTLTLATDASCDATGDSDGDGVAHGGGSGGDGMRGREHFFAPPTLETIVVPARPTDKGALHGALTQLAEQDPLINLRQDDLRQEISVSLYGEVQKEVIQATLATDYHLDVTFAETTTICIERPTGTGTALEIISQDPNPFLATIGLRIDPAPLDSGIEFRLEIELGSLPLSFLKAIETTVTETLGQGMHGWQVTDCTVTLTQFGLLGTAEPLPRCLRQEHVQHGRRLPQPDASRAHGRAAGGRNDGVRTDAPLPPRTPRRHARTAPARALTAGGHPVHLGAPGLVVRAGGRHPGRPGARPATAAAGTHPRRRRPRVDLRPLPEGDRQRPGPAADGPQSPRPQGVPAARRPTGLAGAPLPTAAARSCARTYARPGGNDFTTVAAASRGVRSVVSTTRSAAAAIQARLRRKSDRWRRRQLRTPALASASPGTSSAASMRCRITCSSASRRTRYVGTCARRNRPKISCWYSCRNSVCGATSGPPV